MLFTSIIFSKIRSALSRIAYMVCRISLSHISLRYNFPSTVNGWSQKHFPAREKPWPTFLWHQKKKKKKNCYQVVWHACRKMLTKPSEGLSVPKTLAIRIQEEWNRQHENAKYIWTGKNDRWIPAVYSLGNKRKGRKKQIFSFRQFWVTDLGTEEVWLIFLLRHVSTVGKEMLFFCISMRCYDSKEAPWSSDARWIPACRIEDLHFWITSGDVLVETGSAVWIIVRG